MVVEVEVGGIELTIVENHQNQVFGVELTEVLPVVVVVQTLHIVVEPHLAAAQSRTAMTLQADAFHVEFRQQVTQRAASLDHDVAEALVEVDALQLGVRLQTDLDDFGLAVGVGGEVGDAAAGLTPCEVVLAVAGDAGDIEALDEERSVAAVAVHTIIYGTRVALLEDCHVDNLALTLLGLAAFGLADEYFFPDTDDLVGAVLIEDDDIVEVRAVADELVLLQARADESFLAVDIQLLVGLYDFRSLDAVEAAYFREAGMILAVFVLDKAEPVGRHLYHIRQVAVDFRHLILHAGDGLVGFVLIEFGDALHLDFQQPEDILLRHLAHELRIERGQPLVDILAEFIRAVGVLERLALIDAFLDEDAFERCKVQRLHQLAATDEQFLAQQLLGVIDRAAQHLGNGEETRLVLIDNTAVGRDADFAVRTGIQGIDGLVGTGPRHQMNQDFHARRRHVLHLAHLDLAFLGGLQDAVDELAGLLRRTRGLAEGYLRDGEGLGVALLDFRTHPHHAASLAVVVFRHIDAAPRGEVRIELEGLVVEISDSRIAQLVQVMRQDLRAESHGNTLGSLCQQQRELHGQRDGLLVAAVVAELPLRRLRVEDHIEGELRQACLDISSGSGIISREDIAPVTLTVDEQFLLPQLHQRILDAGIAVGVELHGVADDVCHLVVTSVVHPLHRVKDAALNGLEAVGQMRHSALQNYIRGIVQEPILVHAVQMVGDAVVHRRFFFHSMDFWGFSPAKIVKN